MQSVNRLGCSIFIFIICKSWLKFQPQAHRLIKLMSQIFQICWSYYSQSHSWRWIYPGHQAQNCYYLCCFYCHSTLKEKFFMCTWPCNKLYTWHFLLYDSWQCEHKKLTCKYCWELVEGLLIHSLIHWFIHLFYH